MNSKQSLKSMIAHYMLGFICHVLISAIQAQSAGRSELDVFMITLVDFNVPSAKISEHINELSTCVQFANDLAPERNAALIEMVEHAKKSSKRGVSDEEREVEEALWGLRQSCDARWMLPFELHPSAESQSNRRPGCLFSCLDLVALTD